MISQQCPKLEYGRDNDFGEVLEAFSLTYLASYADFFFPARVIDSYSRAWGIDILDRFARTPGSTPNMLVCYYQQAGVNKVHVSIEGIVGLRQLWLWQTGCRSQTVAGLPGYVFGPAAVYAADLFAVLATNSNWLARFTQPNTAYTFSGFSLGAMIAEIMAYQFKLANPLRPVQVFKFGCAKVGTPEWYAGRNPNVPIFNYAMENDPIALQPRDFITMAQNALIPWVVPTRFSLLAQDPRVSTFDRNGQALGGYQPNRVSSPGGSYLDYIQPRGPANPWTKHDQDFYRLMFSAIANHDNMLRYRFLWLETPEENSWGQDWLAFREGAIAMKRWINPFPDPVTPDQGAVSQFFKSPPAVQQQVTIRARQDPNTGVAGWGQDDPAVGGGDWGDAAAAARLPNNPAPAFPGVIPILPRRLGLRRLFN